MGKVELHQTGIDRLLSLINLDPTNEKAYFNLGMITMDEVGNIIAFTLTLPPLPFPLPFILLSVTKANCQFFKWQKLLKLLNILLMIISGGPFTVLCRTTATAHSQGTSKISFSLLKKFKFFELGKISFLI